MMKIGNLYGKMMGACLAAVAASATLPAATVSVSSFKGTVYGPGEATLAFTGVDAAQELWVAWDDADKGADISQWSKSEQLGAPLHRPERRTPRDEGRAWHEKGSSFRHPTRAAEGGRKRVFVLQRHAVRYGLHLHRLRLARAGRPAAQRHVPAGAVGMPRGARRADREGGL